MLVNGYRPSTSEVGHHVTLIQSLPLTLGVNTTTWVLLDALRRKRNANDYTGDGVTLDMVTECIEQGQQLRTLLQQHLQTQHPTVIQTHT